METDRRSDLVLLRATNPENGTVNYTCNNNLLASKTDAKGQIFAYQYDTYNRLTSISLGGSALLRTFIYDNNTLDGTFSRTFTAGPGSRAKRPVQAG